MGSRENKLGMGQGFESSEPAPSMVLLPVRPHILDLHKLGNKCSNGKACGRGYFLIQTTTWVIGFIFCSTELLFRNSFSIPLWWSIVLFCYSSFRVLSLLWSHWSIWSWILYNVRDRNRVSLFWMLIPRIFNTVHWRYFPISNVFSWHLCRNPDSDSCMDCVFCSVEVGILITSVENMII